MLAAPSARARACLHCCHHRPVRIRRLALMLHILSLLFLFVAGDLDYTRQDGAGNDLMKFHEVNASKTCDKKLKTCQHECRHSTTITAPEYVAPCLEACNTARKVCVDQENDESKEEWLKAEPLIRCEFCTITVRKLLKDLPLDKPTLNEDHVYNNLDALCKNETFYDRFQLFQKNDNEWAVRQAETQRPATKKAVETHAMKKLCIKDIWQRNDDIKDFILKQAKGASTAEQLSDLGKFATNTCEKVKLCKKRGKKEL
eukprot:gnl/TRDRNA2_/TRDRNA2_157586_c0_seq1.p1 gnl/TRDRNA2_/TRDRNA2_157586_c0~~gnl/TRDRNA2_/TRDRNA2_157586_c0_seq1.p1  ORF type:complete len:285 (+),score=59.18 gnl/TRDRNA2_/TRDRNA2_157586_c0_seq1:83-856(+)